MMVRRARRVGASAAALALACQFGSTGSTGGTGTPGGGSTTGDDGSGGSPASGTADGGPTSDAPTGDDADGPTGDDGPGTSDSTGSDGTADPPLEPAPWWDAAWSNRRELVITETATEPLPAGYTVRLEKLDTAALIGAGELLPDHADLRVVRWDGATSSELTRRVQRTATVGVQRVWWKTQAEVDGTTKNEYWLYWNNPAAGEAPSTWVDSMAGTSEVYLAADDFEAHLTGECPDGWGACAPEWSVQSVGNGQVLRGISPAIDLLLADYVPPADVIVHARVRNANTAPCPGLVTHVSGGTYVWAGYGCESGDVPVPGVSLQLVEGASFTPLVGGDAANDGEWRSVEVSWLGGKVGLHQDGLLVGGADGSAAPQGGVGLSVENNAAGDFDDVFVRLFVDPEPTVELGDEELAP